MIRMSAATALLAASAVLAQPGPTAPAQPRPLPLQEAAKAAEAAKNMGAALNMAPVIDAEGRIVPGQSSGAALNSGQGLQDGMRLLQGMTGIEGVDNLQGAGQSGLTGATARMTGSADFNCQFERGARKSVAGVLVRLDACVLAPGSQRVVSVSLGVCEAALDGAQCTAADFAAKSGIPANTYVEFDRTRVGVGCSDSRAVCRVTVTASYSIATSGATLASQSQQKAATLEGKTLADGFKAAYTSEAFSEKYVEEGARLKDCIDGNEASAADGTVRTCDGKQTVETRPKASCAETRTCARTVESVSEFTRSCVRTFPLTTWHCNKEMETRECLVTTVVATGERSSSCEDADIVGGELVATVDEECIDTNAGGDCLKKQAREQYVFPDKVTTVGECYAAPMPLAGPYSPSICAQGRPEDVEVQCASDGWFGRTLPDSECVGSDGLPLDFRNKAGCGVCIKQEVGQTCYAQQPNSAAADTCGTGEDFAGCALSEAAPESVVSGLVISQRETYTCKQTQSQCVEWTQSVDCQGDDLTWGTDRGPGTGYSDTGTMSQALAQAGVLNAIQQSVNEGGDTQAIRIFSGKDSRCRQPVGFLKFLSNDCCRISLERPGGSRPLHECSAADVELAAARRSNFTVYIGDYCSSKSGLTRRCRARTQTYCAFPGLLPRIVQEQGRAQLAQMVGSSADAQVQTASLRFKYYADTAGWGSPVTVNGVTVVPWQQSKACAVLPGSDTGSRPENCGNLTLWVAVCERPQGCSRNPGAGLDLPAVPEIGSQYWLIAEVNPLRNVTTVVSRYATVKGACDTASGECRYEVSAWPAGVGGKAILARLLSFPVQESSSAQGNQTVMLGDYMLRGLSLQSGASTTTALPATMQLRFSSNAGATWSTITVPSVIDGEIAVPGTDVRIAGGCQAAANLCEYRVVAPVSVAMKPWGSAQAPDCSGFTMSQVSVLDFSKMDLSEWLRSVSAKITDGALGGLAATATRQAQAFGDVLRSGNVRSSPPMQQKTAVVSPVQGFGPFTATVSVSGFYPYAKGNPDEDRDPVYRVEVDWGDCTETTVADPVGGTSGGAAGSGFQARHVYPSPDKVLCSPREGSIDHIVKVTIYAQSGVYVEQLTVRNAWRSFADPGSE